MINGLSTGTGQWMREQVRINRALVQLDGLQDVSVRVIGPKAYLSGQVRSESDKAKAVEVVQSFSNLQAVNFIRVIPGPLFSMQRF